jgi:hypothetical protein
VTVRSASSRVEIIEAKLPVAVRYNTMVVVSGRHGMANISLKQVVCGHVHVACACISGETSF